MEDVLLAPLNAKGMEVCAVTGEEYEPGTCCVYGLKNGMWVYVHYSCDLQLIPPMVAKQENCAVCHQEIELGADYMMIPSGNAIGGHVLIHRSCEPEEATL